MLYYNIRDNQDTIPQYPRQSGYCIIISETIGILNYNIRDNQDTVKEYPTRSTVNILYQNILAIWIVITIFERGTHIQLFTHQAKPDISFFIS